MLEEVKYVKSVLDRMLPQPVVYALLAGVSLFGLSWMMNLHLRTRAEIKLMNKQVQDLDSQIQIRERAQLATTGFTGYRVNPVMLPHTIKTPPV